jgi:hypothetical protein
MAIEKPVGDSNINGLVCGDFILLKGVVEPFF